MVVRQKAVQVPIPSPFGPCACTCLVNLQLCFLPPKSWWTSPNIHNPIVQTLARLFKEKPWKRLLRGELSGALSALRVDSKQKRPILGTGLGFPLQSIVEMHSSGHSVEWQAAVFTAPLRLPF